MAGLGDDSDKIAVTDEGTEVGPAPTWSYYRLVHPIPQLQGPLEETILEAHSPPQLLIPLDAAARRKRLLENDVYERTCSGRWKPRNGERYHPLWKLIAQLSFGLHLLANAATKSEAKSVRTLQGLVNELDGFLQRTVEDFQLATQDVGKRIDLLEVPLRHLKVFDAMLENPEFRLSIAEINVTTELVVGRWSTGVQDALKDVEKGLHGVGTFGQYIRELDHSSAPRPATFDAVLQTMFANVHGWNRTFLYLRLKGMELAQSFDRISRANLELQHRAAFASQKNVARPAAAVGSADVPAELDSVKDDMSWPWEQSDIPGHSPPNPLIHLPLDKSLPTYPRTLQPIPEDQHDDQSSPPPPFPIQQPPQPEKTPLLRRRNSFAEGSETPRVVLPPRPSSAATFRGAPRKEASGSPLSTKGWTNFDPKGQSTTFFRTTSSDGPPSGDVPTERQDDGIIPTTVTVSEDGSQTLKTHPQNSSDDGIPEPKINRSRLSMQSLSRSEKSKAGSLGRRKSAVALLLRIFSIKSTGRRATAGPISDIEETGFVRKGATSNTPLPVPAN